MVLVGAVLSAALIVTTVRHDSNDVGRVGGNALAANGTDSRQPMSAIGGPITPSENPRDGMTSDREHGWGPFRTVDW
jgi:hypothetical protein